jgi:hypothetical protein
MSDAVGVEEGKSWGRKKLGERTELEETWGSTALLVPFVAKIYKSVRPLGKAPGHSAGTSRFEDVRELSGEDVDGGRVGSGAELLLPPAARGRQARPAGQAGRSGRGPLRMLVWSQ